MARCPNPPPPRDLSDIRTLKKYLKKQFGQSYSNVACHRSVDELREINNAVKHEGRVSKQLAKYPGWVRDKPLGDLNPAYGRLVPDVPRYLADLAKTLGL